MSQSSVEEFSQKISDLKENEGLKDIKFYPGMINETVPEDFCAEANRMIDAAMANKGRPLVFDDSKRKDA